MPWQSPHSRRIRRWFSTNSTAAAIEFAVHTLGVSDIVVCGHYGCGGVTAALQNRRIGLADNWLRHVQDVRDKHEADLKALAGDAQHDRTGAAGQDGGFLLILRQVPAGERDAPGRRCGGSCP